MRLEAERAQLCGDPLFGEERAARTGPAVGEAVGEVPRRCQRLPAVERRRELRSLERVGVSDGERRDQERQRDDEPGPAVEAGVDRPLERATAPPPTGGWGSRGRDTGL
jgi:hypothetical protein